MKVTLKSSRHIGVLTGRGSETVFLDPNKETVVDFADEKSMNTVLDYEFVDLVAKETKSKKPAKPNGVQTPAAPATNGRGRGGRANKDK